MTKNVGGVDKTLRIVVGVVLILLAITKTLGPWAWIGVLPLATGLIGNCPLYKLLGINTCKIK